MQNKIEDVVTKSTRLWKIIYKKTEDVFNEEYKVEEISKTKVMKELGNKEKEKKEVEKKDEVENKDEEVNAEEKDEDKDTTEQQEQSVQDTQLSPPSPPHATITPAEIIKIKDVIDTSGPNINPLTAEDLAKILDQSTLAAKLCSSPILVSVDELQNTVAKKEAVKVKTQEPPSSHTNYWYSIPSSTTSTKYSH